MKLPRCDQIVLSDQPVHRGIAALEPAGEVGTEVIGTETIAGDLGLALDPDAGVADSP